MTAISGDRHPARARRRLFFARIAAASVVLLPCEAMAHAADRGHVLLLPTGYYLIGGAAAVAASFLVLAIAPPAPLARLAAMRFVAGTVPVWPRLVFSLLAFLLLGGLVATGLAGSRDPLSNPLPLVVWTVFWIGLTLLQGAAGNLWWWIDPWYAPWRFVAALARTRAPPIRMPDAWGYWPAILQFLGFAWFELVYPAPDDPERLAVAVIVYFGVNLAAVAVFGHEAWSRRGECLSVFLRMVGTMGVIEGDDAGGGGGLRVVFRIPGARLADAPALPVSGALFLLLALSSVSFDGLMRTFFWLGLFGVNPLEFPGRSAVTGIGSLGLIASFAALSAAFFAAVILGERLAGRHLKAGTAGALVWSIIPISLAYHFSHYLTALVINGQYALAALSDPLMSGADLFGTAGMHVQAGLFMGADSAWLVWNLQAAAIVGGHLLAVLVAHVIAFRIHGDAAVAARSQAPLALLMVLYTVFGLWLLSSPTAM